MWCFFLVFFFFFLGSKAFLYCKVGDGDWAELGVSKLHKSQSQPCRCLPPDPGLLTSKDTYGGGV
jgi:hypothetical protein